MTTRRFVLAGGLIGIAAGMGRHWLFPASEAEEAFAVTHTDAEWHQLLTPEQYDILREAGTERPYTSPLLHEERKGIFACAGCDLDLFSSATKYDSRTGWPSFWKPLPHAIADKPDHSFGMIRTENHCVRCGSHIGHVFDDGPQPTGLRYCMNGLAMTFKPAAT